MLGVPHTERAWRYRAVYLPENPYLYDYLTPVEYLDYAGRLFGMPMQGQWLTVGTPESIPAAEAVVRNSKTAA